MAKRRKTNINRKKHSLDGAAVSSEFMNHIEEKVMPTVSELTSEQKKVERLNSFDDATFDGTLSGIRVDRKNVKTDFTSSHIQLANEQPKEEETMDIQETESQPQENVTLGSFLRNERNKKGVSLKSISQNTKISHTNLEYLENDNFARLPNKTYVFGYIKSYAKILGLDQNYCLELARQHYDGGKNPIILESHMSPISEAKPSMNLKYPIFFIFFIAATLSIFLFSRTQKKTETVETTVTEPEIKVVTSQTPLKTEVMEELEKIQDVEQTTTQNDVVTNQDEQAAQKVEVTQPEPKKEVKAEVVTVVKTEPEPKPLPEPEKIAEPTVSEKIKKTEKANEEDIEFSPISDNLYAVNKELPSDKVDEMIPDRFQQAVIAGYQNVFITASKGNSWLTYKSDDKPIKKFVLKEGRNLLIRGKEIRLFLGNINAIDIFLNNKPLKLTSTSGVKSLVFPQENSTKYKLPLFIYKNDGTVDTSDNYQ